MQIFGGKDMEDRQTLKEVPSGKIELVFNGATSTLQFNCHCLDALPYCKAMCCRMRQGFVVLLNEEEAHKYRSIPYKGNPGVRVLKASDDGNACFYLDQKTCQCKIHEDSPLMCGAYHCSPEGKGDRVQYRDGGWLWSPVGALQQLADGSVMDVRKIAKVNLS